tara:strand:- start:173 stop:751 length:579 start_codon:yes stop_codon:yes gene_type:complete
MDLSGITKKSLTMALYAFSVVNGASPNKGCREFEKVPACSLDNGRRFDVKNDPNKAKWLACEGNALTIGHPNHVLVEIYNNDGRQTSQYAQSTEPYILNQGDLTPPTFGNVKDSGHFATPYWNCSDYNRRIVDWVPDRIVSLATFCRLNREGSKYKNSMEEFFVKKYKEKPNCSDLGTCSKNINCELPYHSK